ncbi:MAG: hypothetical protein HYY90_03410 [Candidatus Omnitrophica bacterium]|nr:hypothetical protein [Candidatus Omnitrophota bacterium]MBI2496259.1 hypothetical protein [Candidatus Omnitrophota bacterium]MBI3083391.1 hypothetical protein [Candidatus Omnitrophota bacterium]
MELLIAATMISILFVGLGTHLRGGLTVWQRATASGEALQRQRIAFDGLERDLANAIVYDDRSAAYGDGNGLLPRPRFETAALKFFTVSVTRRRQPSTVRVVTYTCESIDGTKGLWRTSQLVGEARARSSPSEPKLVLPDCEELSFRYAYRPTPEADTWQALEWRPAWPDEPAGLPRLPQLIETSLRVSGHQIRRVFAVPSGLLGTSPSP